MFTESGTTSEVFMNWMATFYHSPFVLAVKIFLGIYVAILIIDLVLLLILRGVGADLRTGMRGMNIPTITPSKMRKRWDKVMARLESADASQYKVAVIEADLIADEILKGIGYEGNNMSERLEHVKPHQLDGLEELLGAHQIRNRIVHEADFALDKKAAHETIKIYEDFLRYLEFM
jgi:hypothetical protein